MKRWLGTLLAVIVCSAAVHADVTLVQTTTIEGGMAAMGGQNVSPTLTSHVKGMRARTDINVGPMQLVTIADIAGRQVIVLRPDQKTAQIITQPPAGAAAPPAPAPGTPSVDTTVAPTGRSQVIDGIKCSEYAFSTSISLGEMSGQPQMPPEAAAMMKDVRMIMKGSMWVATEVPGAAEYIAFQKAAGASDLSSVIAGASGVSIPGMGRMMKAMGNLNGMSYLTEMTMTAEGTGQMAEMMQQMGPMKITTKVTSINTDPIADDLFKVPEGYTVIK
jgi:hypothetical protein